MIVQSFQKLPKLGKVGKILGKLRRIFEHILKI